MPAVAPPTPVLPVTPTTPVLPSGPTLPIAGTVSTPQADIGARTLNTGWQAGLVALLVGLLGLIGVHVSAAAVTAIFVVLTPIVTFLYHLFRHRAAAKGV
jgi:hypothetical protein